MLVWINRLLIVVLALIFVVYLIDTIPASNKTNKLDTFINHINTNYVDSVDVDSLIESAIYNTLVNLDPHSNYITKSEAEATMVELDGKFYGIGVEFAIYRDTITILNVIENGPSQKQGLKAGDRIVTIEDTLVAGVGITNKDIIHSLRGERGTAVKVGVINRQTPIIKQVKIIRDKIPVVSLDLAYEIAPNIGFIKLNRFSANTYSEFEIALNQLIEHSNISGLILDLRGNSGGYLGQAIKLLNEFFDAQKLLVYTKGNARMEQQYISNSFGSFKKGALIILIDEGSASASEIVAGAIQDHDRGLVVGTRSFGKGLVQEQIAFDDGSLLRMTVSRYYTPSGRCIQKPYGNNKEEYLTESYLRGSEIDTLLPDTIIQFNTTSGRIVYGGGGITPDSIISDSNEKISTELIHLYTSDFLENIVFDYVDINRPYLSSIAPNETIISKAHQIILLDNIYKWMHVESKSKDFLEFKSSQDFTEYEQYIIKRLQILIVRQQWGWPEMQKFLNQQDKIISTSLSLFYKQHQFLNK